MFKKLVIFLLFLSLVSSGQVVYQHVSNTDIYSFLDELANGKHIAINSNIKPYSRTFISDKLYDAWKSKDNLNKRQANELAFYMQEYDIEQDTLTKPFLNFYSKHTQKSDFNFCTSSLRYKDSLFRLSVRPIFGIEYYHNENGKTYHRWNGLEAFAYIGNFGLYANLRDNHDDVRLSYADYLDTRPASVYKSGDDFSEMRGGITYEWNWGNIGLVKDHLQWGNYYHYPSIVSAKAPSFTQLKLNIEPVEWFEFNYFHGWLVSSLVDSTRSYNFINAYDSTGYREVIREKYMAANMFTFHPFKHTSISFGNSVVYGDGGVEPAFLIPFLLYKSVDHTLIADGTGARGNNRGQNSHLFFDISFRQIKYLHLYGSLFLDDLAISRFTNPEENNLYSINGGLQISNLIPNVFLTFEYYKSMPLVYKHDFLLTQFETNEYTLGHYLLDNSDQYYASIIIKPVKGLQLKFEYKQAEHGLDHTELGTMPRVTIPFLQTVDWSRTEINAGFSYQVVYNAYVFFNYSQQKITGNQEKYTAPYFHGNTNTIHFGVNYGF